VTDLLAGGIAQRAYYSAPIAEFCATARDAIFARMALRNDFDLVDTQRGAWLQQAEIRQRVLPPYAGSVYLEFSIPRMGRRIDAIVVIGPVVFVLEFKVGEQEFLSSDIDQVVDYALDLRNFHEGSHGVHIAPILICTEAPARGHRLPKRPGLDRMFDVSRTNTDFLGATMGRMFPYSNGNKAGTGRRQLLSRRRSRSIEGTRLLRSREVTPAPPISPRRRGQWLPSSPIHDRGQRKPSAS
jgi:hypothetical protein